ncbi:uncharacterized protein LY79DRAFT_569047, partial [Colletotrichum navitas]
MLHLRLSPATTIFPATALCSPLTTPWPLSPSHASFRPYSHSEPVSHSPPRRLSLTQISRPLSPPQCPPVPIENDMDLAELILALDRPWPSPLMEGPLQMAWDGSSTPYLVLCLFSPNARSLGMFPRPPAGENNPAACEASKDTWRRENTALAHGSYS